VDVCWRPLMSVAVVTQLVTHPARGVVAVVVGVIPPATDRLGYA
jgi:hypothetical protein